jgi:hypothetical protein
VPQAARPDRATDGAASAPPPLLPRAVTALAAVVSLAAMAMAILAVGARFQYPYDIEAGEGTHVYYALRLLRAEALYTANDGFPYLYNVYPPVYSLVLAPLVAVMGPVLATGRLVSLAATLATCGVVVLWLRSRGMDPLAQAMGAVGFASCVMILPYQLSCRPDALAALAGCGTLAYADAIRSRGLGSRHLLGLAALGLLACFTRQSMPLLVTAAFLSLWPQRRWRAMAALAGLGGVSLLLVAGLDLATGGVFWDSIRATVSWSRRAPEKWAFLNFYFLHSQWGWTLLALAAAVFRPVRRAVPPAAWAGLVAASYEALGISRAGAAANYLLPFHFFLVVIGAFSLGAVVRSGRVRGAVLAAVLACAQLATDAYQLRFEVRAVPSWAFIAARRLERSLEAVPGPVLLDRQVEMWMRLGRRQHFVESAGLGLDVLHGGGRTGPLEAFIREGGYSRIVLRRNTLLPGRVLSAMAGAYAEVGRVQLFDDQYIVLAPLRRPAEIP